MGNAPSSGGGDDAAAHAWTVADPPPDVFLCVLAQLRRDWAARATLRATCRGWARLAAQDVTWKALCGALSARPCVFALHP